jgi:hypothetical protein
MKYGGALTAFGTPKPQRWWNLANSVPFAREDLAEFAYGGDSPRLRAPERSGSLPRIHQAPRSHDADLYRLYQKTAEKIEGQGGRNLRVVLDYEMKKRLYRDLAKLGPGMDSSDKKHLVAERHGLQVVRGKIPVPDIRIE